MGLRQNILEEPISSLELRDLVSVPRGTPVRAAVELMRQKQLGCVIVVDAQGKPVGKFTERKLMKLLLSNPAGLDMPIDNAMYTESDCIAEDKPIAAMVELMKNKQLRFICVVDRSGKAVALAGQKGLMEYIAEHFPRQIKVQEMEPKLNMTQREGA